jgi:hypothetical protein
MPATNGLSFTNLHICPQGWFLAGHQVDGSMRTFDLTKTDPQKRDQICRLLSDLIADPAAVLTQETVHGLQ